MREMDLIAGESSKVLRKHGFRSLKLMSVDMEQELGNEPEPFGADYGRLDNGLVYYVRRNSKPRMRAALALAVKVGYVFFFSFFFFYLFWRHLNLICSSLMN